MYVLPLRQQQGPVLKQNSIPKLVNPAYICKLGCLVTKTFLHRIQTIYIAFASS
jgi:hypothetical protein